MAYKIIKYKNEILPYIEVILNSKVIGVDTETTGLSFYANELRLIQLAVKEDFGFIIDCFSFLPEGIDVLKEIFESDSVKVFHNAKFDLQFLFKYDIKVSKLFDTMLASQVLSSSGGPNRFNLYSVVLHYLNIELDKSEQTSDFSGEISLSQFDYAFRDASILLKLREVMLPIIYKNKLSFVLKVEFDAVKAIASMEFNGIYFDKDKWNGLINKYENERRESIKILTKYTSLPVYQLNIWGEEEIIGGVNFDSNVYILNLLKENGINVNKTDKYHLYKYNNHPLVKALFSYRKSSKYLSSFLYPILSVVNLDTNRIYPKYSQIGSFSGRMSSYNPNIQQIPRDSLFRECFCAPKGRVIIVADYSQIELRVASVVSNDYQMINAYKKGDDLHLLTASLVSHVQLDNVSKKSRQAAKAVNFGLIYGMGSKGLANYARNNYGVDMSINDAIRFRNSFFKYYKGISKWHESIKNNKPKELRSLIGRKYVFNDSSLSGLYNIPVQGTAADIAKIALGMLYNELKNSDIKILAIIHDEIILEASEEYSIKAYNILKNTMENAGNYVLKKVPTKVDIKIGLNWGCK